MCSVAFTWKQFHKKCAWTHTKMCLETTLLELLPHLPGVNELNIWRHSGSQIWVLHTYWTGTWRLEQLITWNVFICYWMQLECTLVIWYPFNAIFKMSPKILCCWDNTLLLDMEFGAKLPNIPYDVHEGGITPPGAKTRIYLENSVNTMAANAPVPCMTRSSTAIGLSVQD